MEVAVVGPEEAEERGGIIEPGIFVKLLRGVLWRGTRLLGSE